VDVVSTPYGREALEALGRAVRAAKADEPLAPVTVVVPGNHVGVTARRALASGVAGSLTSKGIGTIGVSFLTPYRLAELLGAPGLAAANRRPVSNPVVAAALRRALRADAGLFGPVAAHPATEEALVASYGEIADLSRTGRDRLAATSARAADVVRLCQQARGFLSQAWYDEADLVRSARKALEEAPARGTELGHVIVYLPQDLTRRASALLRAVAHLCPTTVLVGQTGHRTADAEVARSLSRLGVQAPSSRAGGGWPVAEGSTRVVTTSDADDEVRSALRAVLDAARDGVPLERMAILFPTEQPYARLVHEQARAAGIAVNGTAAEGLDGRVLGRTLLDLLALRDHGYRRRDILGLLATAPLRLPSSGDDGRHPPTALWERIAREAAVVAGRPQWDQRLARHIDDIDRHVSDILAFELAAARSRAAGVEAAATGGRAAGRGDLETTVAATEVPSTGPSPSAGSTTSPVVAPGEGWTGADTADARAAQGEGAGAGDASGPVQLGFDLGGGVGDGGDAALVEVGEPTDEGERDEIDALLAADPRLQRRIDGHRRRAARARGLQTFVLGLIDELETAATTTRSWRDRVAWVRKLGQRLVGGDNVRAHWPDSERRAAERVEAALDRLVALDDIDGPADLDVFRRTLQLELDADLGRVGRFGEGVLVAPLAFAVGLDLDLVVVLGMAEGTLPARVADDSLLPDRERLATNGELPLRRDRVGRQQRLVHAALASAGHHVLCAPRGDLRASNERVLSRWLTQMIGDRHDLIDTVPSFAHAVTHVGFPATAQEYRLRAPGWTGRHDPVVTAGLDLQTARRSPRFTRFDGNLAGQDVRSPHDDIVSATRLESWATCPFAYFMRQALRVEPVEDPAELLWISALDRGSLVHLVLERFLLAVLARPADQQPAPHEPWSEDDHKLLTQIGSDTCAEFEARGVVGRDLFWQRDRARILMRLDRFLDEDSVRRAETRARPIAAELAFGLPGSDLPAVDMPIAGGRTLTFRGSADRVDVADDGTLRIIDYKTGKPDDYQRLSEENPDDNGTHLQLAVYGMAARTHRGTPDTPIVAEYWFVTEWKPLLAKGYAVTDDVLNHVGGTLATIVDGIENGVFPARPTASSSDPFIRCRYCDPDGLGVTDRRREWDRKRYDPALAAYAELAEPA
jgi:RecB family exonuclease